MNLPDFPLILVQRATALKALGSALFGAENPNTAASAQLARSLRGKLEICRYGNRALAARLCCRPATVASGFRASRRR